MDNSRGAKSVKLTDMWDNHDDLFFKDADGASWRYVKEETHDGCLLTQYLHEESSHGGRWVLMGSIFTARTFRQGQEAHNANETEMGY